MPLKMKIEKERKKKWKLARHRNTKSFHELISLLPASSPKGIMCKRGQCNQTEAKP